MAKPLEYRTKPSKLCPYLLETTPTSHYVSASHKIVEMLLINRFGKKNIPSGNFWRLADTSTQIYGAQKYLWPVVKRLMKTYDDKIVLATVERCRWGYVGMKMIAKHLYECKITQDMLSKKVETSESRYNREEPILEDRPVIDIEKKQDTDNLRDWMDD